MGTTSLSTAMVRTIKRSSTIGYYRSVTNRISSFTIEKILFWVDTWYRTALCLRGCDQLCSGKLRWVHRKMYSTGCKRYPLSRIQPLVAPLKAKRRDSSPYDKGSRDSHSVAAGGTAPQLRPPQAGGPHPSRCGLRRTAPPSPRGRLCAPHRAQSSQ